MGDSSFISQALHSFFIFIHSIPTSSSRTDTSLALKTLKSHAKNPATRNEEVISSHPSASHRGMPQAQNNSIQGNVVTQLFFLHYGLSLNYTPPYEEYSEQHSLSTLMPPPCLHCKWKSGEIHTNGVIS